MDTDLVAPIGHAPIIVTVTTKVAVLANLERVTVTVTVTVIVTLLVTVEATVAVAVTVHVEVIAQARRSVRGLWMRLIS